ncbi:hypothetical protein GQX74_004661 [Glossina fuscipes]|nr:hypothetical protein GQX74_004661 [Glossina fuscipes]
MEKHLEIPKKRVENYYIPPLLISRVTPFDKYHLMSRSLYLAILLDFIGNTTEQILHSKQPHNTSQIFGCYIINNRFVIFDSMPK